MVQRISPFQCKGTPGLPKRSRSHPCDLCWKQRSVDKPRLCECGVLSLVSHALFTEDSGQTVGTPSVTLSLCLTWEVFALRSFLLRNNHRERKALYRK
ncbi:hypothetical protein AVEN_145996-1 [Araneus ventricosus]|uniref:Uncharacterized protein n=1 Tax=Araneus ventricosus TaxID=182803 RepID=A0A4Y2URG8_ARAVE|nr:hypothetical protein AVEN_197470-1 [Araneus ventricosus]GBO04128.1 hypothetical protein AVEN_136701-1 [Araneus ventricosus]GBO14150.1 hypothetical protein AVEN_27521-1 [Araneus ventricosus]GBO14215.1 hypothetical protein AVEN_145996-1 [Araneus ventricosus]